MAKECTYGIVRSQEGVMSATKCFAFSLLVLASACLGCVSDRADDWDTTVVELAKFDHEGHHCRVLEVQGRERNAMSPMRVTFIRFIDCGNGPINGQYPVKSGLQ